jgi:diguanylate cyclase (GGDEF)-like protein
MSGQMAIPVRVPLLTGGIEAADACAAPQPVPSQVPAVGRVKVNEAAPVGADGLPLILLVEDSMTSVALVSRNLLDHYRLLCARDGVEALELLAAEPGVELVITDIRMPRMDGQELLLAIRRHAEPRIQSLPVIVMTTADDNAEKHRAFLNGANDFLSKPVDPLELRARAQVHQRLARTIRELEESKRLLAEQATTDTLTRLKNRRCFFNHAEVDLQRCKRAQSDLSVALLDIDHFKRVNDRYGHPAGDQVLAAVAGVLRRLLRAGDTPARLGGEEFALLLPQTHRLGAAVLAERIRAAIEAERMLLADGRVLNVTVSVGVATQAALELEAVDPLIVAADRRLYLAKQSGRNRICVSDDGRSRFGCAV